MSKEQEQEQELARGERAKDQVGISIIIRILAWTLLLYQILLDRLLEEAAAAAAAAAADCWRDVMML